MGFALYLTALPVLNTTNYFVFWASEGANGAFSQFTINITSTGTVQVRNHYQSGPIVAESAQGVITAETHQHIEFKATVGNTGSIEVRVNGVTVINEASVDLLYYEANPTVAQFGMSRATSGDGSGTYIDDLIMWDTTGSGNNDFIGDKRVFTLFPDGNTAQADFSVVGAASGYEAIDEADPDDDTTYIYEDTTGSPAPSSEFTLDDLPAGAANIVAVIPVVRAQKDEAGDANLTVGLVSGASEVNGADNPMTTEWTYRADVFETDPATGAAWTPTAVDAVQLKLARTL
jgi:hypothetical protein